MEFILPSGVVLTSFDLSIVPALGFIDEIGIEDDNRTEAKEYTDDFYEGQTDSFLGSRVSVHDPRQDHRAGRFHVQLGGDQDRGHGDMQAAAPWSGRAIIPSASSTSWRDDGT